MEAPRCMAGVVHTKAEWEIVALAALSCAHCLRASEAITARAEGSELVFRGTKSRSGEQRQEMDSGRQSGPHSWRGSGQAMGTTPTSLRGSRGRTGYTGDCTAFWTGPVDTSSICAGTRSGGSGQPSSTASGSHCGSSCSGVGWKSATVAEIYYKAPPRWQFERGGPIPLPEYGTSATTARMQPGTTLGIWPSWIRSELEIPHVRLARAKPSPEGGTAPVQK